MMRLAAATLLALLALAAPAAAKTEVASLGTIRAELTYTKKSAFQATGVTLRVFDGDTQIVDKAIPNKAYLSPIGMNTGSRSVHVRDLDGDGTGEALFDLYTGGAHCCQVLLLYKGAMEIERNWGDPGYALEDLDSDGVPEFRSGDNGFNSVFSSYAASLFPAQIFRLVDGALVDVTREDGLKPTVSTQATDYKRIYRKVKRRLRKHPEYREAVRSSLAAYTADQCTLGECRTGYQLVRTAIRRGYVKPGFLRRLKTLLAEHGYDA